MKRFLLGSFLAGLMIVFIANAMETQEIGASDVVHETVYMSRHCESGWYIESRDGDKIEMACTQYGEDPQP